MIQQEHERVAASREVQDLHEWYTVQDETGRLLPLAFLERADDAYGEKAARKYKTQAGDRIVKVRLEIVGYLQQGV